MGSEPASYDGITGAGNELIPSDRVDPLFDSDYLWRLIWEAFQRAAEQTADE